MKSLIKLFLVDILVLFLRGFTLSSQEFFLPCGGFLDQEQNIPGNPEIPEVYPAMRSLIPVFPAGYRDRSLTFLTV